VSTAVFKEKLHDESVYMVRDTIMYTIGLQCSFVLTIWHLTVPIRWRPYFRLYFLFISGR